MDFKMYKIIADNFIESDKIDPTDVILVSDTEKKTLYLYKNPNQSIYDEFESQEIYEKILNKFLNPNIILIKSLQPQESDSVELQEVKNSILNAFPNIFWYKIKTFIQNIFGLRKIRENYEIFKNYEQSGVWRRRISNQTNLWKLSVFNVIISLIIAIFSILIILIGIKPIYSEGLLSEGLTIWIQNLGVYQVIIIALAGFIFLVNLTFLIFPLRFPIKPKMLRELK